MFVIFGRCREVWLRAKVVGGLFVKFILIKNDWKIAKKSQNVYAKNTKTVGLVIFFIHLLSLFISFVCPPSIVPFACCYVGTMFWFQAGYIYAYIYINI